MLSNREEEKSKVDSIIDRLDKYYDRDPIMPLGHARILQTLLSDLNKSDKSIASVKGLIEKACMRLDDQIWYEPILTSVGMFSRHPFSSGRWFNPAWFCDDNMRHSFMRGMALFKSPFFLAVWLESFFWHVLNDQSCLNVNQAAYDSLKRWGLDQNVTELQTILHECKSELAPLSQSILDTPNINWYRIGFYAAATAGVAVVTEMVLSQDDPSQSRLSTLGGHL